MTTDGGVAKTVVEKGSGWKNPQEGDKVRVHYRGTLHGTGEAFDSSYDRGEPIECVPPPSRRPPPPPTLRAGTRQRGSPSMRPPTPRLSSLAGPRPPPRDCRFVLGEKQVIEGWEKGVATMLLGERAVLTLSPAYGYGASGAPPKIPPNAALDFHVELLGWESTT